MTRHLQIADHVAVIGFDTCSDHNIVSAEFLCNNNIFPVMQPFDQLLLGLAGHTAVLGLATLAVQFPTGLDHVTFLVIPTLPGPLQALLGKPWLQQRRCVLDLGNDRIQFYGTANTALTLSVLSSSPLPVATSVPLITTGIPGLIKHQWRRAAGGVFIQPLGTKVDRSKDVTVSANPDAPTAQSVVPPLSPTFDLVCRARFHTCIHANTICPISVDVGLPRNMDASQWSHEFFMFGGSMFVPFGRLLGESQIVHAAQVVNVIDCTASVFLTNFTNTDVFIKPMARLALANTVADINMSQPLSSDRKSVV